MVLLLVLALQLARLVESRIWVFISILNIAYFGLIIILKIAFFGILYMIRYYNLTGCSTQSTDLDISGDFGSESKRNAAFCDARIYLVRLKFKSRELRMFEKNSKNENFILMF